jgi:hypothetical protein
VLVCVMVFGKMERLVGRSVGRLVGWFRELNALKNP